MAAASSLPHTGHRLPPTSPRRRRRRRLHTMSGAGPAMKRDKEWQEVLGAMHEISNLLNTGLDRQTLAILVNLCEAGVNPEALALVVQELRKEAASKKHRQQHQQDRSTY